MSLLSDHETGIEASKLSNCVIQRTSQQRLKG